MPNTTVWIKKLEELVYNSIFYLLFILSITFSKCLFYRSFAAMMNLMILFIQMSFNANALLHISGQYNDDNNSNFWTLFCSIIICSKTGWHTDLRFLYIFFLFFWYIFNMLNTCPIVTGSNVYVLLYFTIGHFLRLLKREQFAFFFFQDLHFGV